MSDGCSHSHERTLNQSMEGSSVLGKADTISA